MDQSRTFLFIVRVLMLRVTVSVNTEGVDIRLTLKGLFNPHIFDLWAAVCAATRADLGCDTVYR